jgi:diguanylate cyclase (GGDEF)-like protein
MGNDMQLSNRVGGLIRKLGVLGSVVILTAFAIVLSLFVTLVAGAVAGGYQSRSFVLATIVPAIVGPVMNLVFVRVILQLEEVEERLRRLAVTDDLTGVYNRRHFLGLADQEVARAARFGKPFSVIVLDVDSFKRINDENGHAAGDAVLKAVALDCLRFCRRIDTFARLGGDEFVFLLPETRLDEAVPFAERIRAAIADTRVGHLNRTISITASLGVQTYKEDGEALEGLLDRADQAMYDAKESGRNRVSTTVLADR